MCYNLVMWDFNGTIFDDVLAALASVNDMLAKRGMSAITLEQYRSYIDTPIIRFYENLFDMTKISFDQIATEFHEGYARHIGLCRLMPGAPELLERFAREGTVQTVCSSNERSGVVSLLEKLGIDGYFESVLGASDRAAGSKIERAKDYISSFGGGGRVLFIGDCLHDLDTARAIGADCALCCAGHQDRQSLAAGGALLCEDFFELRKILFGEDENA